jgi:ribosomal protein S18 acetylase RimI-like enzyme
VVRGNYGLADPDRDITAYVAIDDDEGLVGVVGLEPAQDDPAVWLIEVLGVHSDFRRRRIGLELFDTALGHCRDAGAESVTIEVHRNNVPAQRLVKKLEATLLDHPTDSDYFQGAIYLTDGEAMLTDSD